MQAAPADDEAGSDEFLGLAVVCAAFVEGGVALDLRPEEFGDAVLGDGVPEDGPTGGLSLIHICESWHERFAETPDVLKSSRREQTVVPVLDLEIGGDEFITMAGPCSVETEFQLMATANHVRRCGARILRGGAFKPRSSPYSFQGLGLEGLKMLARARQESGLAIVTEVMSETDVEMVAEYADILQIGTRNMENYSLLEAAARSGRPVPVSYTHLPRAACPSNPPRWCAPVPPENPHRPQSAAMNHQATALQHKAESP